MLSVTFWVWMPPPPPAAPLKILVMLCAICCHLCNSKNVKNTPMKECHFRKVTRFSLQYLLKVTLIHGCFSHFLSCTYDTKSRKASHLVTTERLKSSCGYRRIQNQICWINHSRVCGLTKKWSMIRPFAWYKISVYYQISNKSIYDQQKHFLSKETSKSYFCVNPPKSRATLHVIQWSWSQ